MKKIKRKTRVIYRIACPGWLNKYIRKTARNFISRLDHGRVIKKNWKPFFDLFLPFLLLLSITVMLLFCCFTIHIFKVKKFLELHKKLFSYCSWNIRNFVSNFRNFVINGFVATHALIYYAHLASVRFEHSACGGSLMTTYIYIYKNIYIYI